MSLSPTTEEPRKLAQVIDALLARKTVLPGFVGDFKQHHLLLSSLQFLQKSGHVLDTSLLRRHQLSVGEDGDLGTKAKFIVCEVNQGRELFPIIRPGFDLLAIPVAKGHRGDL